MNIGIFTDTYLPDINGVVSSCVTLKRALEELGHTVYVVTNHSGPKIKMEDNILRLPGVEVKRLYGYKVSSPMNMFADSYIEAMDLDVIHIQTEYGVAFYGRAVARAMHIPLVYTYHTMWEDYTHYVNPLEISSVERVSKSAIRSISRKFGNSVQAVIAPSQKTKDALMDYGVISPIYIVPTGLDLKRFDPENLDPARLEEIRAQMHIGQGDHTVIFVGRLAREKMLDMVIQAVDESYDEALRLVIVGSGTDEDHFKNEAANACHPERFLFTGRAESKDIPYYYANADCFVSASTTETQGMTYIEALASGLAVFGRRDPVLADLVDEGITGGFFDTAEELQEKLEAFFRQESRDPKACQAKTVPYSEEIFAHKAASVYEQAIIDYSETYKVDKMRIQDDFVLLTLSKTGEKEPVLIYIPIDDFFELKIGTQARLDAYLVHSYQELQQFYGVYMNARRKIASRDMTTFQLKNWCIMREGLDEAKAQVIVDEFVEKRLISDQQYALDKASYYHDIGSSRQAIRRKLVKAGLPQDIINTALSSLDEDREIANARVMAKRMVHTVKEQSSRMKRQTIINKLISKGYSAETARQASEMLDLEEQDDSEALQQAFKKAVRLYSSLEPQRRREKIVQYCQRKGFSRDQIEELDLESEFQ